MADESYCPDCDTNLEASGMRHEPTCQVVSFKRQPPADDATAIDPICCGCGNPVTGTIIYFGIKAYHPRCVPSEQR